MIFKTRSLPTEFNSLFSATLVQLESWHSTFLHPKCRKAFQIDSRESGQRNQNAGVGVPPLTMTSCVALGKFSTTLNLVMRIQCDNVSKQYSVRYLSDECILCLTLSLMSLFLAYFLFVCLFFLVIVGTWHILVRWLNGGAGGLIISCSPSSSH